jgi:hypothetical protein
VVRGILRCFRASLGARRGRRRFRPFFESSGVTPVLCGSRPQSVFGPAGELAVPTRRSSSEPRGRGFAGETPSPFGGAAIRSAPAASGFGCWSSRQKGWLRLETPEVFGPRESEVCRGFWRRAPPGARSHELETPRASGSRCRRLSRARDTRGWSRVSGAPGGFRRRSHDPRRGRSGRRHARSWSGWSSLRAMVLGLFGASNRVSWSSFMFSGGCGRGSGGSGEGPERSCWRFHRSLGDREPFGVLGSLGPWPVQFGAEVRMPYVLWNSNTLRLSELAVPRVLDLGVEGLVVERNEGSSELAVREASGLDARGIWSRRRQRLTECVVPSAPRSREVPTLFDAWVPGLFGAAASGLASRRVVGLRVRGAEVRECGAVGSVQFWVPRFQGRGVGALRGLWCRGSRAGVPKASTGQRVLCAPRSHGVPGTTRVRRFEGSLEPEARGLRACGVTWLERQVSGRLESSSRSAVSETRRRESWSSRRWRRGVGVIDRVRAVEGPGGKRQERWSPGNRRLRPGGYLEEHRTRGGERSQVRSNRRACGTRLCTEQRLEVEEPGSWQPIRR